MVSIYFLRVQFIFMVLAVSKKNHVKGLLMLAQHPLNDRILIDFDFSGTKWNVHYILYQLDYGHLGIYATYIKDVCHEIQESFRHRSVV